MPRPIEDWRCHHCGQRSLKRTTMPYEHPVTHDGREVTIRIPDLSVVHCTNTNCQPEHPHDTILTDDDATHRIDLETYRQLGLLTPQEIRENRERLGLTQQELADLLRLGGNSLSRWESGAIYQSRSLDTLLRIVFNEPVVLQRLKPSESGNVTAVGRTQRHKFPALGHSGEQVAEGNGRILSAPRVSREALTDHGA